MNCPHCKTDIDEHEATPCLDAWIAEAVFGKTMKWIEGGEPIAWNSETGEAVMFSKGYWFDPSDETVYLHMSDGFTGQIPRYSKFMGYAWDVLEKMRQQDWEYSVGPNRVVLCHKSWITDSVAKSRPVIEAKGDVPHAICLAALKAKSEGK